MKAIHCFVSGRVQGVCYRMSASSKAHILNVNGWVKNLADGRVELKACGDSHAIEDLYQWLLRGPSQAKVINVERHAITVDECSNFKTFEIL